MLWEEVGNPGRKIKVPAGSGWKFWFQPTQPTISTRILYRIFGKSLVLHQWVDLSVQEVPPTPQGHTTGDYILPHSL